MKISIPKAFDSVWSGLLTGVIIGAAALVPTMANAEAQNQAQSAVKVSAESELKGQKSQWSADNTAKPGDTMTYIINYQNVGSSDQKAVVVRASLPASAALVPGSVLVYNQANPNGAKPASDTLTADNGITIGNYSAGANAYVTFVAQIAGADKLSCGDNQVKMSGSVQPQGADKSNASAVTTVKRECAAAPQQSPAPAPTPTPTPPATTTPTPPATPTTPATPVTPTAPSSSQMPNTGPGDVFAIFGVASVAGFFGHKLLLARLARR